MNVKNVEMPFAKSHISAGIRALTVEKYLMNIMNVKQPFNISQALRSITEITEGATLRM